MKRKKDKKSLIILIVVILLAAAVIIGALFLYFQEQKAFEGAREYQALMTKYAEKYQLDPYLVAAVVDTESDFRSDAISRVGAVGLMQIMPTTAEWIAEKLKIENFSVEELTNPEINIEFGCWYLSFLQERFNGNIMNISAAYNAGHNAVAKWLENSEYSSDGTLTAIPYEETENYVKKVQASYEKFKKANFFND